MLAYDLTHASRLSTRVVRRPGEQCYERFLDLHGSKQNREKVRAFFPLSSFKEEIFIGNICVFLNL